MANKKIIGYVTIGSAALAYVITKSWVWAGRQLDKEDKIAEIARERLTTVMEGSKNLPNDEVISQLNRLDLIRRKINADNRFSGDEFIGDLHELEEDDDKYYRSEILINERKVEITIYSTSNSYQNDKNCIRLYVENAKEQCEKLKVFVKSYVTTELGEEVDTRDYRSLSDLDEAFLKKTVITINNGDNDDIIDLLYWLTNGYKELEDGSYDLSGSGKTTNIKVMCYQPIIGLPLIEKKSEVKVD